MPATNVTHVQFRHEPAIHHEFEYKAGYGTLFQAPYADFRCGVTTTLQRPDLSKEEFAADVAEMIGHHAKTVKPKLKRFIGYRSVTFKIPRHN